MKSSTTYQLNRSIAVLVVGEPKAGKTRLAMAFPRPGILDCDNNLSSAVRVAATKPFSYAQPFVTDDGKEVPEAERWMKAVTELKLMGASSEVDTIVIDGMSNLCRWGLVYAESELVKAGINIKKEYLAKYQSFIPLLSNLITMIRIPRKFVMVNVHQTMEKNDLTGTMSYKLDIPGRLADTLGGQFTDVWGMQSVADFSNVKYGAKYSIRTKPSGYHINLGTSFDLEPSIDITGKTPDEIWRMLEPKLSSNANASGK